MYFAPGYQVSIPFSDVDKGKYALGMVWQQGDRVGIIMGNDSVNTREVQKKTIPTNW